MRSGSQRGTVTAIVPPGRNTRTNSAMAAASVGMCSRTSAAITRSKAPSGNGTVRASPRTTPPLQALTTLNDPAFVEAAAALARRTLAESGPDAPARAAYAFRLCLARAPDAAERDRLVLLFEDELAGYRGQGGEKAAAALIAQSDAPAPPNASPAELAAWTVVANVILNLDEALTKN